MDDFVFVQDIAQRAGAELVRLSGLGFDTGVKNNDSKDVVTSVDIGVNNFILGEIKRAFPDDGVYSEEGGGTVEKERMWVIDPIDGSSNFSRAIPHFAVSIGLIVSGVPTLGAVYNPVTRDLFSFEKGKGAYCNGSQVHVSARTDSRDAYALLTAGRKDAVREWGGESYKRLLANFKKTKNLGSSALDICFVGAGRVEVVIYGTLTTKDIAPALGFLYEAGGVACSQTGEPVAYSDAAQRVYIANNDTMLSFVRTLLES
jgi:myo-inositol-1(or 4)-monophosphatase